MGARRMRILMLATLVAYWLAGGLLFAFTKDSSDTFLMFLIILAVSPVLIILLAEASRGTRWQALDIFAVSASGLAYAIAGPNAAYDIPLVYTRILVGLAIWAAATLSCVISYLGYRLPTKPLDPTSS